MSSGLDNLGDLLDSPGYKGNRGGGGRVPGTGGPGAGGPSGGYGGTFASGSLGGGLLANPGRRRLPGGYLMPGGDMMNTAASMPTAASVKATPSPAVAGMAPGGWMKSYGGAGRTVGRFVPPSMRPPASSPPVRSPGGGASGPAGFDPNNPWGRPLAGGSETEDLMNWLINQGGAGGNYSATGNAALMDAVRANARSDADALHSRALTSARLNAGGDPSAAGYASLQSELNGQNATSGALADASLAQLGSRQDLLDWLLKSRIGADQAWRSADQGALLGRIGQGEARRGQGGLGGFLGDIAGQSIGGWLAPGGWFGRRG